MASKDEKTNNDIVMKDAQFRKNFSIAYFNSLNNAINLVTAQGVRFTSDEKMLEEIIKYQMFFMDRHNEYYARMIANVGVHFDKNKTLERLRGAISKPELTAVWLSLSEDERQDPEIKKVAYELRSTFLKAVGNDPQYTTGQKPNVAHSAVVTIEPAATGRVGKTTKTSKKNENA